MAIAIERYFNIALFLLVLTGFATLASTGELDLPAVVLVGTALLFRGYQLVRRLDFVIPERWTNYLTLVYVLVYFGDYFFLTRSFLTATVHLVLFLMVVRLFSLQRARDHYLLAVLSFLMVLASAVLTVASVFVFAFAGFLLVAVITFVLMEMRHSIAQEAAIARAPSIPAFHQRMTYSLLAIAPALMLLILAGGFLIFFFYPGFRPAILPPTPRPATSPRVSAIAFNLAESVKSSGPAPLSCTSRSKMTHKASTI